MGKVKDLRGMKIGRLTPIEQHGFTKANKHGHRHAVWYCKCDCGNFCEASTDTLLRKRSTPSCGCVSKEHLKDMSKGNITHGMSKTHLYRLYYRMIRRCCNANNDHYHMYGGRGIRICDEWLNSFETFAEWAYANGYEEGLSIDRIDVNGNYEPSNCRWISVKDQSHNKRQSRLYEYNGKVQDVAQWANEYGLKYGTLLDRLNRGWSIEEALTKEIDVRCWHKTYPPRPYEAKVGI